MAVTPQRHRVAPGGQRTSFVGTHGLWTDEQSEAADRLRATIEERHIEVVRVSFPDLYGLPRGKTFTSDSFLHGLRNGFEINPAPLLLGSADERIFASFSAAPLGMPQLSGSTNLIVIPDPLTFRILPWAEGTAWVIGDCYFQDGSPCPLASRFVMKRALEELYEAGFDYRSGLEVECYLFKIEDPRLRGDELGGGPGQPAPAPEVTAVAHGYKYLHESHLDQIDEVLLTLRRHLADVGLTLRSIDDEWGPGQVEFVLQPLTGMAGADAMFLLRTAAKQVCRRMGYLVTFMCQPAIPACCASGWHLHQSLTDVVTGENAFTPTGADKPLSAVGRYFVGGLLKHASASSVFTTPTVTGYKRRRPFSLAPDRVTWAVNHRGAMVRVWGTADPEAWHIENRIGEPAANPYLYMASQIVAGLDGIRNKVDPGPPSLEPYSDTERPLLPKTLMEAVEALKADDFYRSRFGETFVDYLVAAKEGKIARYLKAVGGEERAAAEADVVTEWEHREYFERL